MTAMSGANVVLQAPTASGKTLAFQIPLLERLVRESEVPGHVLHPADVGGPARRVGGFPSGRGDGLVRPGRPHPPLDRRPRLRHRYFALGRLPRPGVPLSTGRGDDQELHPAMMGTVLIAADIIPAAAHLTASMLSSAHPGTKYLGTQVTYLAYGQQTQEKGIPWPRGLST